jgi:hypothetical protein
MVQNLYIWRIYFENKPIWGRKFAIQTACADRSTIGSRLPFHVLDIAVAAATIEDKVSENINSTKEEYKENICTLSNRQLNLIYMITTMIYMIGN